MLHSKTLKILEFLGIFILFLTMIANMSRSVVFWMIIMTPISMIFLKRYWFKKVIVFVYISFVVIFFASLYLIPISPLKVQSTYKERHSLQRMTSLNQLREDFTNRNAQLEKMSFLRLGITCFW